eukprot:TRINITY_DN17073_c0_g1_i1.p1 TRINITY_DN17073_c0_g1~~TRINITY_DN17073_c0_g1_i1.p1  ORF type:complete len:264 (+),score=61.96 TRINITY_DN17073_c0_g1_i1:1022-1813(+)
MAAPQTPTSSIPNTVDPKELSKLQAMMGGAKKQEAKLVLNETGKKEVWGEDEVKNTATVFIKSCNDCEYTLNATCTKVFIESCVNTKLIINGKIVTSVLEVYKCENLTLELNSKIGTLQTDMSKNIIANYNGLDSFQTVVWAGCYDLSINLLAESKSFKTGFTEMAQKYHELRETIDQFIIRWIDDQLLNEKVIRLENGFPTTEREKKIFDDRQEEALRKFAENAGITIGKKKESGAKIGPNEVCPKCKSGKKYKKCCGKNTA